MFSCLCRPKQLGSLVPPRLSTILKYSQSTIGPTLVESSRSHDDRVHILTLNDPKTRNSLSKVMMQSLLSSIKGLGEASSSARLLQIRSKGPVFSSGHNLKEIQAMSQPEREDLFNLCSELMLSLQRLPIPVLAVVNGLATAAGCQLVASCDISLASKDSRFGTPGVKIGLFCSTPGVALVRRVPNSKALDMLLTGREITAEEAEQYGLISRVVESEGFDDVVRIYTEKILESSAAVLARK
eukprot:TRINITY_DN3573_c0_g1_i1.p1 TRINITY_DN3573_c0_g1~~TRINITY_DN3573_c0_g1_i1.p1  ORF type:complete len:241 (+),score=37.25 TRINITY_DN3573_c0_g1_i1:69-791(+)